MDLPLTYNNGNAPGVVLNPAALATHEVLSADFLLHSCNLQEDALGI